MLPLSYTWRNVVARRGSSFASMFGIALVVFVLAASMMLVAGVQKAMGDSGSEDVGVVVSKGSDGELASSVRVSLIGLIQAAPGVKTDANGPISVAELVVVMALEKAGEAGSIANVQMRGVPLDAATRFRPNVKLTAGRMPNPGADEVMVGQRLIGRFTGVSLGDHFEVKKNRPLEVVGVFEDAGSASESELWADIETVRSSFGRQGIVSSVRVQLTSVSAFDTFEAMVEQDKRLGLDAHTERAWNERQSGQTKIVITFVGVLISVFFAFGAAIGAMITLYAAVASRQRELGILRALGFPRRAILAAFLLEAAIIAIGGGLMGVVASLGMGFVHFSTLNYATWSEVVFSFTPTAPILLGSLLFAVVVGLIGGFLPALRAARMRPVQAMRG